MEQLFHSFVGNSKTLPKGKNIVARISEKISSSLCEGQLPEDVVKRFAKLRVIIRMRYVSHVTDIEKQRKEKKPKAASSTETEGAKKTKLEKKMKRIVTCILQKISIKILR